MLLFYVFVITVFLAGCVSGDKTKTEKIDASGMAAESTNASSKMKAPKATTQKVEAEIRSVTNGTELIDAGKTSVELTSSSCPYKIWMQDASRDEKTAPWYDIMSIGFVVIDADPTAEFRIKVETSMPEFKEISLEQAGNVKTKISTKTSIIKPGQLFIHDDDPNRNAVWSVADPKWGYRQTDLYVARNPKIPSETSDTISPNKAYPTEKPNKMNYSEYYLQNADSPEIKAMAASGKLGNPELVDEDGVQFTTATMEIPAEALSALQESGLTDLSALGDSSVGRTEGGKIPFSQGLNMGLSAVIGIPITIKYSSDSITILIGMDAKTWQDYQVKDKYGKPTGKRDPLNKIKEDIKKIKSLKDWSNDKELISLTKNLKTKGIYTPFKLNGGVLAYLTIDLKGTIIDASIKGFIGANIGWKQQFFFGPVPAYISFDAAGQMAVTIGLYSNANGGQFLPKDFLADIKLTVECGIGIAGILSGGIVAEVGPEMHVHYEPENQKKQTGMVAALTAKVSTKVTLFIFYTWKYDFASGRWIWYEDPKGFKMVPPDADDTMTAGLLEHDEEASTTPNFKEFKSEDFVLDDNAYSMGDGTACEYIDGKNQLPQAFVSNEQVILKNIPDGTNPKLFILDKEEVLVWIAPDPDRPKFNNFTLWFSTRKAGKDTAFTAPKKVVPDLKIDGSWCNIADFTGEVCEGVHGWGKSKRLVLAWVQITKPLKENSKPEEAYPNTAIYSSMRWDGEGWNSAEQVSEFFNFLQYKPRMIKYNKTIYLSWIASKDNDYFNTKEDAAKTDLNACYLDNFWNWKHDRHASNYHIIECCLGNDSDGDVDFSYLYSPTDESTLALRPANSGENLWELNKIGLASNLCCVRFDGKNNTCWWESKESGSFDKDCYTAGNVVYGVPDDYKKDSPIPIVIYDENVPISSNYQFILDKDRNVQGIIWDVSTEDEKENRMVSHCYAKAYIQDPADPKKKIWTNAVPVTYHDKNDIITNPTGILRGNGDWVITYRKITNGKEAVTADNFFQSHSDLCTATVKATPILNTELIWQADSYYQHPGKECKFTVIVTNQGITPSVGAKVILKTKEGKVVGETSTKDVIYPGKLYYLEGIYKSIPGKDGVASKHEVTAFVEPLKGKNSEFASYNAKIMIGVPDFQISDVYFSSEGGSKRTLNVKLWSANGVKVPAGQAELVITERQIEIGGKQKGAAKIKNVDITKDLTEDFVNVQLEYDVNKSSFRGSDKPTRIDISLVLHYKKGFGSIDGIDDDELEEMSAGSATTYLGSPYYYYRGIEPFITSAKYDSKTGKIDVQIGITNNWPEDLTDNLAIDLVNTQTKHVEQSIKLPFTTPMDNTTQGTLSFKLTGETSPQLYAVRIHGNGSQNFDNTDTWRELATLASESSGMLYADIDEQDKLSDMFTAFSPSDYDALFSTIEEGFGFTLRREIKDRLKQDDVTMGSLYRIIQAEQATLINVE